MDPEGTWAGATHAWVLVVKLVVLKGLAYLLLLKLMVFWEDTLKAYHYSTKIGFM